MILVLFWVVMARFIKLLITKEKPTFKEELGDFVFHYLFALVIYVILISIF
jgi:hypothetical protein